MWTPEQDIEAMERIVRHQSPGASAAAISQEASRRIRSRQRYSEHKLGDSVRALDVLRDREIATREAELTAEIHATSASDLQAATAKWWSEQGDSVPAYGPVTGPYAGRESEASATQRASWIAREAAKLRAERAAKAGASARAGGLTANGVAYAMLDSDSRASWSDAVRTQAINDTAARYPWLWPSWMSAPSAQGAKRSATPARTAPRSRAADPTIERARTRAAEIVATVPALSTPGVTLGAASEPIVAAVTQAIETAYVAAGLTIPMCRDSGTSADGRQITRRPEVSRATVYAEWLVRHEPDPARRTALLATLFRQVAR